MKESKKQVTLTFDVSEPRQAMVYEYLQSFGRKKTKQVITLVSEQIKKENAFAYQTQSIQKALFEDENFINIIKEGVLKKLLLSEEDLKKGILKQEAELVEPIKEPTEQKKEEPIAEIDLDLIMQGIDMFS